MVFVVYYICFMGASLGSNELFRHGGIIIRGNVQLGGKLVCVDLWGGFDSHKFLKCCFSISGMF